jgi:hypothetical protein
MKKKIVMLGFAIKVAIALLLSCPISVLASEDPLAALKASQPSDFAVAVRDTRMFAGMEPYAKVLGRVAAGEFYPAISVTTDQYGIVWAEVALPTGDRGFLSDVVIVREREPALRELLKKANLADIGLWDDDILKSIQESGVEIGFSATQLLFAQGPPLMERVRAQVGQGSTENLVIKEWFYPRLVVLIENDSVVGYTSINRLPGDRSIAYLLSTNDPEFSSTGRWESKTEADGLTHLLAGEGGVARFRIRLPIDGTWRLSARWVSTPNSSTQVLYEAKQKSATDEDAADVAAVTLARMVGNQRLHDRSMVELGIFEAGSALPLLIEISAEDGKPISILDLRLEYVNDPVLPAEAAGDNVAVSN